MRIRAAEASTSLRRAARFRVQMMTLASRLTGERRDRVRSPLKGP
jgi:hypothetical protein